jgi:hypothetical protein
MRDFQVEQIKQQAAKAPWPFPINDEDMGPWVFPKSPPKSNYVEPITIEKVVIIQEKDPNGKSLNETGAKADHGKSRAWLCLAGFSRALEEVAKVTTVGANKYTPNGWCDVPDAENRYMDAFARHMLALGKGEVFDNGVGGTHTKHLAQMIWNLLAVLELQERNEST